MKPIKSTLPTQFHKLKVVHLASGDLWAGAEMQLFTLAVELQRNPNIELQIFLLNYGQLYERLTKAGVSVLVFNESQINTFGVAVELYRALRRFKPQILHTHRLKENIIGSVVAFLFGNTPSIRTVHGAAEHSPNFLKPQKQLLRIADDLCGRYLQKSIITVSEDLADKLSLTLPTNKLSTILNGIDCESIQSRAAEQVDFSDYREQEVKICFVGRLAPVKRLDLWMETAELLVAKSDFKLSFYIIGDGPEKDHLASMADKLQIGDQLRFLGEQRNVPALLEKMDILLLTSDHEGLPMAILEALCTKTLVVAHSVGGIKSLLDNGKAGYLVTNHSCKGYAQEVLNALKHPQQASQRSENGFLHVITNYSAKSCADKYVEKYHELVK